MSITIHNLTPHVITVTAGHLAGTYPSEGVARVDRLPLGEVVGLPAPAEGHRYIVSVLVAERELMKVNSRNDLFCPGEQERDSGGRIVGCRSLVHPREASPALHELLLRMVDDRILQQIMETKIAARDGDRQFKRDAAIRASTLLGKIQRYTSSHTACYHGGWSDAMAHATARALNDGREALADILAHSGVDVGCSPPGFCEEATVPAVIGSMPADWIENGCRRTGRLCWGGHRQWLDLNGAALRPLYLTADEAEDIRRSCEAASTATNRADEFALLWDAARRDERLHQRRDALRAKKMAEADRLREAAEKI